MYLQNHDHIDDRLQVGLLQCPNIDSLHCQLEGSNENAKHVANLTVVSQPNPSAPPLGMNEQTHQFPK